MAIKQGKIEGQIKKVPIIRELKTGLQLFSEYHGILKIGNNDDFGNGVCSITYALINKEVLSMLVIEYKDKSFEDFINSDWAQSFKHFSESEIVWKADMYEAWKNNHTKLIPLKYSQWESALKNNEVDTGKIIEFEIVRYFPEGISIENLVRHREKSFEAGKIIPKKKNMVEYEAFMGVGSGDSNLFVYGSYNAIKVLQGKLVTLADFKKLAEIVWNAAMNEAGCLQPSSECEPLEFEEWWEKDKKAIINSINANS